MTVASITFTELAFIVLNLGVVLRSAHACPGHTLFQAMTAVFIPRRSVILRGVSVHSVLKREGKRAPVPTPSARPGRGGNGRGCPFRYERFGVRAVSPVISNTKVHGGVRRLAGHGSLATLSAMPGRFRRFARSAITKLALMVSNLAAALRPAHARAYRGLSTGQKLPASSACCNPILPRLGGIW